MLIAIFDVPKHGLKTFLINENYKAIEVEPTPQGSAADILFREINLGRQIMSNEFSFSSLSDPLSFDVK